MKKTLLLIAVLTTSLLAAQNIPNNVPTNGLIGWWPFDGNANDQSGNNHDGTVYGATLGTDRYGNPNSAYEFDYTNWSWGNGGDRIFIPHDVSFSSSNITVSIWANRYSNGYGSNEALVMINRYQNGYSNPHGEYWGLSHRNQASNYNVSAGIITPSQSAVKGTATTPPLNTWHHYTLTYDGSYVRLYIDGLIQDSTASTAGINTSGSSGISIGVSMQANGEWHPFDGLLDDVGYWNRALSPSEIIGLFNDCQDSLVSQPSSNTFQTVPGNAHFTTAHSDTSASYQWQQNTGTGWTNLGDFGIYSGTTTDSLVMTGITTALNGYGYRCVIDACTMDTTDIAYLTVVDNVGIDEDEATITIAPNPTSGLLTIGLNSTAEYKVYNVNGQVVAKGNTDGQIDLTNLPSGSYQLILDSEEGSTVHTIQKI